GTVKVTLTLRAVAVGSPVMVSSSGIGKPSGRNARSSSGPPPATGTSVRVAAEVPLPDVSVGLCVAVDSESVGSDVAAVVAEELVGSAPAPSSEQAASVTRTAAIAASVPARRRGETLMTQSYRCDKSY